MSNYEKQNFVSGQILKAEHLNHMEDGIGQLSEEIDNVKTYVTPEMFGAVGDGVSDDTQPIIDAINTGKPVLFQRKTYKVTGFVFDRDVDLRGNGCTIIWSGIPYNATSGAFLFSCITPHLIKIDGFNLKPINHVVGFCAFRDGCSASVTNCTLDGASYVDGEWVDTGSNQGIKCYASKDVLIDNCHFKRILSMGAYVEFGDGFTVRNCTFEDIGRGGVYTLQHSSNITIENNKFYRCTKNFTISDGALDIYGAPINNVRIVHNYIEDFGSSKAMGCGIRIKGADNVVCEGNTIVTNDTTYPFAGIMMQERYGIKDSACIIKNNYINFASRAADAPSGGYCMRLDDCEIMNNVIVADNTLRADTALTRGISVRDGATGLLLIGNIIETTDAAIEFYPVDDYERKNIRILNNELHGLTHIIYCDNVIFTGNTIIWGNPETHPVLITNSTGCIVDANIVNASLDFKLTDCFDAYIGDNNLTVTPNGTVRSKVENKHFVTEEKGTSITAKKMRVVPMVSVYGSMYNEREYFTMDDMSNWDVFNANGEVTLNVGDVLVPDSVPKYAIPTMQVDLANYTDENGNMFIADYRDWGAGVDWHYVRAVVFTGTEPQSMFGYYLGDAGTSSFVMMLSGDDLSLSESDGSGYNRYDTQSRTNYYSEQGNVTVDGVTYYQEPLYCFRNGTRAEIYRAYDHLRQFTSVDEFLAWCAEKYAAGTPLTYYYPLLKPYSTPIPADELAAYKAITASGNDTVITTSAGKKFTCTTFIDDAYRRGVDKLIGLEAKTTVKSAGVTGTNTTPGGTLTVTIDGVTYHLLTAEHA